jgi:dTDP-4-dehydrorhamnose reductase/SAM-dependent methyltransferase
MKIMITGASGLLGSELKKVNKELISPTHAQCDVTNVDAARLFISECHPDIIIHCAAVKDNRKIEQDPSKAICTNVIGSAHLAIICFELNIRLVYISTDYCYKGDRGNYKETDEILPFNLYSWLKLGGEASTRAVKNHLIIRTSFGANEFEYKEAFVDKWVSKEYVDKIAPMILEAALSPLTGVLNMGTERKTIYQYASQRSQVKPVKLSDTSHLTPYDNSFNLQKWMDYKSSNPTAKPHTKCRVCRSEKLTKYLDLGLMPLANNLEASSIRAREKERFPLQVMFCEDCGLSQLSVVVDPVKMFSYYTYRSSVNGGYVKHCRDMAQDLRDKFNLITDSFVIDIAGNDGALLKEFQDEIGCRVLNIDPATNLAAISEAQGVPAIADFWNEETARRATADNKADLITATNVFAHVDDVRSFLENCERSIKEEGVIVLEFPYLIDFIENMEFDTVYFEHLSYMSLLPLHKLCGMIGLKIIEAENIVIHGGSVRVTIAKENSSHAVEDNIMWFLHDENEKGFNKIERYKKWSGDVQKSVRDFGNKVLALKKQGCKIAAFAASAKGNTLLNAAGLNTDIIEYICDQTPEKIGKYSPGTGIAIVHPQELTKNPPDYVIILSWNFSEEIIPKIRELCNAKIIIPIPEFTEL